MIDNHIQDAHSIIQAALDEHDPSHIICLFSGGYDSMVLAHVAHLREWGRPLLTYSIDTLLSADGWTEYVAAVGKRYGWCHRIERNERGFQQYLASIAQHGQPYSRQGHTIAYRYLKDRAIDAIKRRHKLDTFDRVVFLSGLRRHESAERMAKATVMHRRGSGVWVNPLIDWTNEQVLRYRLEHNLPENPFYETVGGSGDCQCNWGQFIDLDTLRQYSPCLAARHVAEIDTLSREHHGWGWGEKPDDYKIAIKRGQQPLFDEEPEGGTISPFLCEGCSRSKARKPGRTAAEEAYFVDRLF